MALAEVIDPPADSAFEGGEVEHWTSIFGFEGLFDEAEQRAIKGWLPAKDVSIINLAEEGDPDSHAVMFDLHGTIDVVVYDAAEAMKPVIGRLIHPLQRVYFFCHDETEENLAKNEAVRGHNFTDVVVGYLGRTSHEG